MSRQSRPVLHSVTGPVIAVSGLVGLAGCVPEDGSFSPFPPTQEKIEMTEPTRPGPEPMTPELLTPDESDRLAFEQAVAADSNAALLMFLSRNPNSPRADDARARLAERRTPDTPQQRAIAGSEAGLIAEFDAARLSGSAADREAFLARHGNHPLARQAGLILGR